MPEQNSKEDGGSMSYQESLNGIQRCISAFIEPALRYIVEKIKEKEDDI